MYINKIYMEFILIVFFRLVVEFYCFVLFYLYKEINFEIIGNVKIINLM